MATKNITISNDGWQDLETLGELSLVANDSYTIEVKDNGECEVCIATSQPQNTFRGHTVKENISFTFTYKSEGVWIKPSPFIGSDITVVIS